MGFASVVRIASARWGAFASWAARSRQYEHRGHYRRNKNGGEAFLHVRLPFPQSASASRFTAGAAGFLNLSQSRVPSGVRLCVPVHSCAKGDEPQCARAGDWMVRPLA